MAWTKTRSLIALEYHSAKARGSVPDPGRIEALKEQLKAERAEDYLQRLLRTEPALSAGRLSHLAGMLTAAAGQAGGDAA